MSILRTPEERFANLPDFNYRPHFAELADPDFGVLRMHYIDEGPADAPVILLLHGQGCWSYIYRHMIPLLVAAGFRVIAPDFIGFGRSDKLPRTEDYSFEKHVGWIKALFRNLQLRDMTGYFFDWGGYFGLRIAADEPDRFARIALSNTQLPIGEARGREWFIKWREEQFALPKFPQGEMVNEGVRHPLSAETIAAFDAPYIDETYKTGPRRCPMILPISPDMPSIPQNRAAWKILGKWTKPVLTLFSADFAGTAMGPEKLQAHIPGTRSLNHELIQDAGFYIVEDQPEKLAHCLIGFAKS
ncbi:MAG: haloalkane dehalogenase [Gammaproteobacteria bacterium]|nr:haloalkane dehalogenase [Gammaproteobacteria bacterium]